MMVNKSVKASRRRRATPKSDGEATREPAVTAKPKTPEDRVDVRKRLGAIYEFIGEDHSTANVTLVFERISDRHVFTVEAGKLRDNKGVRVPDHVRDRLV
jgi:hypothetical protein